jgi:hypothetical protein
MSLKHRSAVSARHAQSSADWRASSISSAVTARLRLVEPAPVVEQLLPELAEGPWTSDSLDPAGQGARLAGEQLPDEGLRQPVELPLPGLELGSGGERPLWSRRRFLLLLRLLLLLLFGHRRVLSFQRFRP